MSLQPVTGVLAAVVKAAEVSDAAAASLAEFALFEALSEQIEDARPMLERDTALFMDARNARARSIMLRTQVGKALEGSDEPFDVDTAQSLRVLDEYVSKGLAGELLGLFNRKHPRDPNSGQFVSANVGTSRSTNTTVDNQRRDVHTEAETHIARWKKQGVVDDSTPLTLHFKQVDPDTGQDVAGGGAGWSHQKTTAANARKDMEAYTASDPSTMLSHLSVARGDVPEGSDPRRRAALDAMMTFAGSQQLPGAGRIAQSLPLGEMNNRSTNQIADDWNRPGDSGDRKTYRRLSITGQALSAAGAPGSTAHTVGNMARLIGDLGPEAEKVLGPGIRRTAYRYRGTERRPDATLMRNVAQAGMAAEQMSSEAPGFDSGNFAAIKRRGKEAWTAGEKEARRGQARMGPRDGVIDYYANRGQQDLGWDDRELRMRGDVAAIALAKDVPDLETAAISIAAGELPPSQGVIINADGELTTQAQGFNGDHYLPFDLKNLRELQGGQYVRTRASGGPTTEDVYTGLIGGARQLQVVSNSGVYTVEFDPDVRGGRRYTDKALRMIQRYGKLLEAIESGGLYEQDLSATERSRLRTQAATLARYDEGENEGKTDVYYKELLRQARLKNQMPDTDEIKEKAEAIVDGHPNVGAYTRGQRANLVNSEIEDLTNKARKTAVRQMVLDGKGYASALLALKQEFPFFIRHVQHEALPTFLTERGQAPRGMPFSPKDRGFVGRGQTNPASTAQPLAVAQPTAAAQATATAATESVGDALAVAGGRRSFAGGVLPQAAGAQRRLTMKEALAADSPAAVKLAESLARIRPLIRDYTKEVLDSIEPVVGANNEVDERSLQMEGDTAYALRKMLFHFPGPKGAEEYANWLLTKATEEQRNQIKTGFAQMVTKAKAQGLEDFFDNSSENRLKPALETIDAILDVASPFAVPEAGKDPMLHKPSLTEPKPVMIKEITDLGIDEAEYEDYLKVSSPDFQSAVEFYDKQSTANIADSVITHLEDWTDAESTTDKATTKNILDNAQKAWTFLTARKVAQVLTKLTGGRDAGPKAPGPEREEVAHRDFSVESFCQRVDRLLGQ